MNKLLIVLALAGLLSACANQGSETSDDLGGSASVGAISSEGAGGSASVACEEAFAPIADMELSSFSDLGDLQDEVAATVEGCESIADWTAGAQAAIGVDVNPNAAVFLLGTACDEPSLADMPICEELASS